MAFFNLFIPLFNIEVDENLLGKEFINKFVILSSEEILLKPNKYVFDNFSFTKSFIKDITKNGPNKWLLHPYAKYVLFKTIILPDDKDKTVLQARDHYKEEVDKIMLSLRLVSNGFCQINNLYMLAPGHSIATSLESASQVENITINHTSKQGRILVENLYNLTKTIFEEAQNEFKKLDKFKNSSTIVPISFFHRCYNSETPSDRILNLAIVLESTMLAGRNQELNYRLFLRTSAFLGRDVKKLLEIFYTLRSEVVHNGTGPDFIKKKKSKKDIYDEIAQITGIERKDCTELIFYFIKDHIESIVREILKKSIEIFINNKDIKTYENINTEIEKFILKQITTGFEI